ncbi:fumarylacetoacetate hydrolase family protein [Herbaspirillum sp. RV1423]|uniref:fumarylacetoacetate hydrolase family protein n=1 Tax=Herbaspirillum sp. RV1423 TaxID=1443993 RepID=UPI0004B4726B|nr:fumarylacetoacetate hydrolase family protein [Herbaspirillum sp. RV1423]
MKWIHFTAPGATTAYGILDGQHIVEVEGGPFGPHKLTECRHRLDEVKIEVPFIPRTFYAAGLNYVRHVKEYAEQQGKLPELPGQADIGYRAVNALIAHDEAVVIPYGATQVQYEGELAVVIGCKARRLTYENALSCVLGYTIGNDVSERNWQKTDRTFWRAKNSDTFKPMGPWIETDFDIDQANTTVRVNGEISSHFRTNEMLFDIRTFISTMTRNITLYPGDVIWMGTDGKSPNLRAGDVVEVEIDGLGCLRNHFVDAM